MMSDQDFRERVLNAIEDLKRTHERSIEEVKESIAEVKRTNEHSIAEVKRTHERSIEEVKESIAEVKRTNERSFEEVKHSIAEVKRTTESIDTGLRSVETDVAWIKGTFEGKQEAISNKDVKFAIWIARGSAVLAIISLIKSFW